MLHSICCIAMRISESMLFNPYGHNLNAHCYLLDRLSISCSAQPHLVSQKMTIGGVNTSPSNAP